MANIGNLSFLIGGDDKGLKQILEDRKKDAVALQNLLSSFTVGKTSNSTKDVLDSLKIQERKNRLIESEARAGEAKERRAGNSLILEQKLNNEIEKGIGIRSRNATQDNDRITSEQKLRSEIERTENIKRQQLVNSAKLAAIEKEKASKELINQQRLQTEIQRTEAAKRRAELVGTSGQGNYNNAIQQTSRSLFSQKALLQQLTTQIGFYFSIYQVGRFVKEMAMVSGELEKQRLSLSAILKDKEAANRIFGQIRDLAVYSPFNYRELVDYTKQLSAFSFPANELFDTMKRLADVSAGLGVDMRRIVLAVGQVRSATVLRGQEVRQFTEAGIPLVDELAKKFTKLNGEIVTTGDVFDKISKREVPYAMIKEIFQDMTNEGGMFYQMQEIQATSLAGKISNLRDAYDIMLDAIGTANSDLLKGGVDAIMNIMDKWEKYWAILKTIILGYGAYKAAVIAATIAQQGLLTTIKSLTIAQTILNAVSKINPYALAFAGIVALIGGLVAFVDAQDRAKEKLLSSITDINNQAESVNKLINRLKELTKETKDNKAATAERAEIIKTLSQKEPELAKAIKDHADNLDLLTQAQERYNTMVDAKKFAKYAISETGGFFTDDLVEKLEKLAKAENVADMNAVKLDKTYSKILETMNKAKEIGGVPTNFGKIDFAKGRQKQIEDILKSEKTHAEKVLEVYDLIAHTAENARYQTKVAEGSLSDTNLYNNIFTGSHKSHVKEYSDSMWELSTLTKDANQDLTELAKTLEIHFKNKGVDVFNKDNEELIRTTIKSLDELGKYGQKEVLSKWNIKFELKEDSEEVLEGWRKELNDKINSDKNVVTIHLDTDMNEVIDDMKKTYKEVKTRMDEQKPLLIKLGFDIDKNKFPFPLKITEAKKKLAEGYIADKETEGKIEEGGKMIGMDLSDFFKPKEKGSKKDEFTEKLKRQVEIVKSAKKEYSDLLKLMSAEDAFKNIQSIEEYKGIQLSDITEDGYVNYLKTNVDVLDKHILKIGKKNADTAENVRLTWNKELGSIQIETLSKNADKELKKIEKQLSQYKDKYNLYEEIFGITGDKGQAAQIAFGDPAASVMNYIDTMKAQLKNMSGGGIYEDLLNADQTKLPEAVRELVEDIRQAIQEKDFALQIDMSKIIAEYSTTQDKINTIHNQYEKQREDVENSNLSAGKKKEAIDALTKAEQEAVKDLEAELLQLSPFYNQLFGDLTEIGYRHLDRLIKKAKETVDLISNTQNEDGKLKYGNYNNDGKLEGYYLPNEDGSVGNTIVKLKEYERILKRISGLQKDQRKSNPLASLMRPLSEYGEGMDMVDIMSSKMQDFNAIVQSVGGELGGMFDALGNEDAADTTQFIGEMVGAASNIAMGIASGNPVQVIQGIIGGITSIAQQHDKKLDKAIKKSQTQVKYLKNEYSELQRVVERQLGAISTSQAKQQVQNLEKQKRELESQRRNEIAKKKTDWNTVADYENQISEIKDQIRYFYEDLAGEEYGIKIKDWAKSISDALVEAWSKGEDAAKAFDATVADIMKNVFKNVLQLQYVEPMMEQLRTYMFGTDGKGGILGDGDLSKKDMNGLVKELTKLKGNLGEWQKAWEILVEAAKEAGINLEDATSEETLSKGIAGVTEDTANLLASYINAMRADLSVQRSMVERILLHAETNKDTFALMQAEIMRIQINTLATANNTTRLVELSEETYSLLRRVSTSGSGVRFNIS
ncbi:hypothetical protein CLV62_12069 [Dysgonomonas alginatilytica]|uniref:Tape measure protein N-terminal domain-containing protein n=1 Tax=Dysgonomonas alginatilytica TaxID=1605892 RepID=A0A2V3PL81_9BACT|nr:tape measure protein [Dysgonomonas alginatilytica]PXV62380.1 hypothetical protein CLV62_12069 [Dysgonomonas alginatilytica]